ncbi:hypothetical protein PT974_03497 [Cladobotryum mycophilum]|uniref:Uncharacterized protein n=1 Tax=Cladobotryum mycophilum TaxID=491253 RepID=A0ABR0SSL7_9HYPO
MPGYTETSEEELQTALQALVKAGRGLEPIPITKYGYRIHNKARHNLVARALFKFVEYAPDYNPLNEEDSYSQLMLAIACAGQAVVQVPDGSADNWKRFVWGSHADDRYKEIIPVLMSRCLEEHINERLQSLGQPLLYDLYRISGFKDYASKTIQSDRFLNQEISEDLWNGHHFFSICMLFVADFLQDPWSTIPAYDTRFKARTSYKVLEAWSYTMWADKCKDSVEKTDKIVTFFGSVASITYAPPSNVQLSRPTPASDQLEASLGRLEHETEVINEWKTYCETMDAFFRVNMQPKWQNELNTASSKSSQSVCYWMNDAYSKEFNLYADVQQIRVIIRNPEWGYVANVGCPLVQGPSILLANGEMRMVENLITSDQLHTGDRGSKLSESVSETQCIVSKTKVVLVGFNGETPFATPAQVFYTSTGLRAIDARAPRTMNPFQRIGKLAVGHVIYRRNGERYESIEIQSIEKTEASEQMVYTVFSGDDQQYYHANGYLISQNEPKNSLQIVAESIRRLPKSARLPARLDLELDYGYKPDPKKLNSVQLENVSSTPTHSVNTKIRSTTKRKQHEVSLDLIEREFEVTAHHPNRIPSNYQLPSISVIDGRIVLDDKVQFRSSCDLDARTLKWTRDLPDQKLFEHGMIQIDHDGYSGNGVVYVTADPTPKQVSKDGIHAFRLHAKSVSQSKDESFIELQRYRITVDRDVWKPDTERDQIADPMVLGELSYGQYNLGDKRAINTNLNQDLDELYRFERETIDRDIFRGTVRFHRASMIPFISDSGEDVKIFDIKFPQLGLNMNLPVLFQELYLDFDWWVDSFYGALYESAPDMRGMMGNRHLIRADYVGPYNIQLRSKVSQAFAAVADPSSPASPAQPASITDELVTYKEPELNDLVRFVGYNEEIVHTTTQTYIQHMMYYHMDQDDRKEFTNQERPTNLPRALANDLPSKFKAFFKDKYAPAFLCRSIESFAKYSAQFTETEKERLWYWWEGNGEKCLSRSQEYNDLNNIASIETMKILYASTLDPFFNSYDGPVVWAQKLRDKLAEKRVMNNLLTETTQSGASPINRECMVMNTLATSEDFADQWFVEIMAFAGEIGFDYPYIDEDSELTGQWLHDSMHDLILKVLLDDPSITNDVKEQLLKDIVAFEEVNNLDQKRTTEQRAAAIVTASSVLLGEASYWFTAVGKGLSKALGASRLYQWVGTAFDQVAQKVSTRVPGTKVGFYIGQIATNLIGAIQSWDTLSDDQRATVILETLKIATAGASYAIEAFKRFMEKPMTSALDQLDLEYLNQGTYRAFGEGAPSLGKMSDEINGPGGFHDSVANHVGSGDKTATRPSKDQKWNEKITDPVGDLPPGGAKAAKKFSIPDTILKGVNIALGIGVAAAMTFTLARQWDDLTTAGKIINTLSVITEMLTVLLDVVEIGISTGVLVVSGTMSVALPIIGAVLAVVGFVLTFISFFVQTHKSKPPPDPIKEYVNNTGKPLISKFNDAPKPQLSYSISHRKVNPGQLTKIEIVAKNNSSKDVSLTNTRITLLSGDDNVCLFSAPGNIELVSDAEPSRDRENRTYVTPDEIVDANLPQPSKIGTTSTYYQMDLRVAGPRVREESAMQALVLKPAQTIRSIWTARINKRGAMMKILQARLTLSS